MPEYFHIYVAIGKIEQTKIEHTENVHDMDKCDT